MVYTTPYSPIEISTAITILLGLYIGLQSVRESPDDKRFQ
jgi:hypothetical protein